MKKTLKIAAILLSIIVIIIIGFASFISIRGIPTYETQKIDLKVESTPERVAQGKKLATMLCVKCHYSSETNKLTGKLMTEAPKEFGEIYSRNITQHLEKGIGAWSDGEIAYLLRTGIRKDGHYSPPYMAKLPHISDEDLASIIAWLRSDDVLLAASDVQPPEPSPSFLVKFLCFVAFKPFEYPKAPIAGPDKSNPVAFGKYIANAQLDCYTCHSADFKTDDFLNPEKSIGFYGGGNHMNNEDGTVEVLTANITMDKVTGIGSWTEEDFISTVKFGKRPNGEPIKYPMEPYALLDSTELKAIFSYLKTVPAITNKVMR